jgi:arylsulfatase A-like enzyme
VDLAPTLAALVGKPMKGVSGKDLGPLLRGEAAPALTDRAAFMETGLWFTDEVSGVGRDLRIPYPPVLGGLVTLDQKRGGDLVLNPEYERMVVAAKHRALRTRDWKLVYVPLPDRVRTFLYDVRRDPFCVTDVSARHPEVARALIARLTAWMRGEPGSIEVGPYVLPGPEPQ